MEEILQWVDKYSAPVVVLLALGAVFAWILKELVEKTISSHLDHVYKEISLKLEKRSVFEEKVLMDQYLLVKDLQSKIENAATDLNRIRHGKDVSGLIVDGDIVPLTEVFQQLVINKYLLKEQLYKIIWDESWYLLKLANERSEGKQKYLEQQYDKQREKFCQAMNDVFGIDKISW